MADGKKYRLEFEDRNDYLHVSVQGEEDSYEISMAYWREIAAECEKRGCTKVMVEEDIPVAVSLMEMYNIASEVASMFRGIAVAFVDKYADQTDLNSFGEVVAQNRGVTGRFFANAEKAEEWLLSRP